MITSRLAAFAALLLATVIYTNPILPENATHRLDYAALEKRSGRGSRSRASASSARPRSSLPPEIVAAAEGSRSYTVPTQTLSASRAAIHNVAFTFGNSHIPMAGRRFIQGSGNVYAVYWGGAVAVVKLGVGKKEINRAKQAGELIATDGNDMIITFASGVYLHETHVFNDARQNGDAQHVVVTARDLAYHATVDAYERTGFLSLNGNYCNFLFDDWCTSATKIDHGVAAVYDANGRPVRAESDDYPLARLPYPDILPHIHQHIAAQFPDWLWTADDAALRKKLKSFCKVDLSRDRRAAEAALSGQGPSVPAPVYHSMLDVDAITQAPPQPGFEMADLSGKKKGKGKEREHTGTRKQHTGSGGGHQSSTAKKSKESKESGCCTVL